VTAPAQPSGPSMPAVVELAVPAATEYVGLVRTVAAGMATRLDLDLDHVEDMRLAVSEACAVVLPWAAPGARLQLRLTVEPRDILVEVAAATTDVASVPPDSFAWTVLRALADAAASEVVDDRLTVRLSFRRRDGGEHLTEAQPA
jgi:serine/threonine-protein kinase RsbW